LAVLFRQRSATRANPVEKIPEIVTSPLSRPVTSGTDTVRVHIYQGDPGKWLLEVEDKFGNSTVWNDQFDTDQQALDEVMRTIADEGIGSLVGAPEA
jgi:hypothetical protein